MPGDKNKEAADEKRDRETGDRVHAELPCRPRVKRERASPSAFAGGAGARGRGGKTATMLRGDAAEMRSRRQAALARRAAAVQGALDVAAEPCGQRSLSPESA